MVIAAFNQAFWRKLCAALERPEWVDDPRFSTVGARAKNRELVLAEIEPLLALKSNAEWAAIFSRHDVPYGPVQSILDLVNDPNVEARQLLEPLGIGGLKAPIRPVKYSAFAQRVRKRPPRVGEDTEYVLREMLGKSPEEIETLTAGLKGNERQQAS